MTSKWSKILATCQKYDLKTILTSFCIAIVVTLLFIRDRQLQNFVQNQVQRVKESLKVQNFIHSIQIVSFYSTFSTLVHIYWIQCWF